MTKQNDLDHEIDSFTQWWEDAFEYWTNTVGFDNAVEIIHKEIEKRSSERTDLG